MSYWRSVLEGSGKTVLESRYPQYMLTYFRFKERTGPQCPFCIGVLKNLYSLELNRLKGEFVRMFESQDWTDYE